MTSGKRRDVKLQNRKQHVDREHFYILVCELWIYFRQTRGDGRKTSLDSLGEFIWDTFYLNKVCLLRFNEAINPVFV